MTLQQMQKVFNGYLYDNYFVCQLAFFEGLTVHELTKLPEMIVQDNLKPLMEQLSREYGVDYETVCKISETVLKQHMQHSRIQRASGIRSQAWDELDDKLLPQVIEAVDAVYHAEGRPQKVSVTGIQRRLGLAQKQLYNLPKCKAYIEKHTETQPEYWAREVVWAIGAVEASGQELNWKRVRELTNMKPNDLRCCMEFITDVHAIIIMPSREEPLSGMDLYYSLIKSSQSFRSDLCKTALSSLLGVSQAASSALFYPNHPRKSL